MPSATCGPDLEWRAVEDKTTKCVDVPQAVHDIFDDCGGDLETFAGHLVAQPFKHGAVGKLMTETNFKKLFITETKLDLKTGKAKRKLAAVDQRFVPQRMESHE